MVNVVKLVKHSAITTTLLVIVMAIVGMLLGPMAAGLIVSVNASNAIPTGITLLLGVITLSVIAPLFALKI